MPSCHCCSGLQTAHLEGHHDPLRERACRVGRHMFCFPIQLLKRWPALFSQQCTALFGGRGSRCISIQDTDEARALCARMQHHGQTNSQSSRVPSKEGLPPCIQEAAALETRLGGAICFSVTLNCAKRVACQRARMHVDSNGGLYLRVSLDKHVEDLSISWLRSSRHCADLCADALATHSLRPR